MATHVLVVGEALIDIVEDGDGIREMVGGGPLNIAVGLGRQGIPVSLHTRVGDDDRGRSIREHVRGAAVSVEPESWTEAATSTARAVIGSDGAARYAFDIDWTLTPPRVESAGVVHAGSIALFLAPGGDVVLDAMRRAAPSALVTLDPNIRPALVGAVESARRRFEEAAAVADLVKLSDEDAEWLYPGVAPADLLPRIRRLGPRAVVVTRGPDGAIGQGADGVIVTVPGVSVDVADTIGAGDAFMASLITSVVDDPAVFDSAGGVSAAMHRAAVMAAITVSRAGANPPTRAEVDRAL